MRQLFTGLGLLLCVLCVALSVPPASAQYFGKNKVQYSRFQWRVIETEHFQVYYYESEAGAATDAAQMAERSYNRLSHILRHDFRDPIPLVLYASHSQFQQTNIQPDMIDEGTGGVTEFLKRRVYLPFTGSYAELEHVLSHELVHAFQVDILFGSHQSPVANPFAFQPPGWFMEGMAEYLSLGGVDANTEMWLRDAALQGYLLPLKTLDYVGDIRVYRFGQSIWEYIARRFGEDKVGTILRKTGQVRNPAKAIESVTGLKMDKLSDDWLEDVRVTYLPQIAQYRKVSDFGKRLTEHEKDHSNFNVTPAVSPTGDKVAFISDRGLATSLYLSSTLDGKSLGRLQKGDRTAGFESFRFFTSSTDWSPDGTRLAFPAKSGGSDALYVFDVKKRKPVRKMEFAGLDAITSPAWSPDGKQLVFTGYAGGMSDLYLVNADGSHLERLTADRYADLDAAWSPDGRQLAFSTDRGPETDFRTLTFGPQRIALFNLDTRQVTDLPEMSGKNISPHWSPDGKEILFVSTRTGIPNLFKINVETGDCRQLSDLLTGISGITEGSPPISVSRDGRRLVYSAFERAGWDLFAVRDPFALPPAPPHPAPPTVIANILPDSTGRPGFEPGRPVHGEPGGLGRVALTVPLPTPTAPVDTTIDLVLDDSPHRHGLDPLDGGSDHGWNHPPEKPRDHDAPGSRAAADTGAVNVDSLRAALMQVPDTTSFKHKRYRTHLTTDYATTGAAFGSNVGLAGQAVLSFSDILGNKNLAIAAGVYGSVLDSDLLLQYADLSRRVNWAVTLFQYRNDYYLTTSRDIDEFQSLIYRGAELSISRPFNKFSRLEFNLTGVGISDRVFQAIYYSDYTTRENVIDNRGTHIYIDPGIALVKDTAVFGSTGPVDGTRARLSLEHAEGGISFTNAILDYRRYLNIESRYALAVRLLGANSAGRDPQMFRVGGPATIRSADYGDLEGSHAAIMNLEFRFPFIDRLATAFPLPFEWPSLRAVTFFDMGGVWGYNRSGRNATFHPFSSDGGFHFDDMTAAYGVGLRMGLGFLVLRYDVAQPTNLRDNLGRARHFFSLGADF